jgi:hypothetical protein
MWHPKNLMIKQENGYNTVILITNVTQRLRDLSLLLELLTLGR